MRGDGDAASSRGVVKVPGADATVVHGFRIWDKLFSLVSRGKSKISLIFHSARSQRPSVRSPETQVWPMPLPFPEMHVVKKNRGRRTQLDAPRKLGLNFIILVFNFLAFGNDLSWRQCCPGLGTPLNRKQWAVVKRMRPLVDEWNSEEAVGPAEMGRTAAKTESIESVVEELSSFFGESSKGGFYNVTRGGHLEESRGYRGSPGEVVGQLDKKVEHVAKDIEAGRLKFWGRPCFNPVPFLDDRSRSVYLRPFAHARVFEPQTESVPRVRVRCSREELFKFLHLLDSSDRLGLFPSSDIREGLECGAFCVPKDGARDRLILDARAPNQMEQPEDRWIRSLGSVQQMGHFFLTEDEELRLHTEDLREFYHSFLVGEERSRRNAFKVKLSRTEASRFRCFRGFEDEQGPFTPVLNTMAMGDCNAVSFGQISHLGALVSAGILKVSDLITLEQGPPRQRWFGGLMIDDLLIAETVPRGSPDSFESFGKKKVAQIRDRYAEVGLPRHEGKAESFASNCTVWGVQIDGRAGVVRPSLKRVIPLCFVVCNLIAVDHCTVGLLEILAGSFVSIFQVQRRHMSVLEEIYAAQRGRKTTEVVRLSRELRDELLAAVGLAVVTFMNMRLSSSGKVIASDASSAAEAAVAAEIAPSAVLELQRLGLNKGLWNRLLNPYAAYFREKGELAVDAELPEETYDMHPVWKELATSLEFRQYGSTTKRSRRRHINIGEVKAALAAEKIFSVEEPEKFYLHLQDSQVSLACMVKGRSSSRAINVELKKSIPYATGQQVKGFYGYVRSKLNPADDPTRDARVRPPSKNRAAWLNELEKGSYESYDKFLTEEGVNREQTNRLPDESELYKQPRVDLRSAKQRRKQRTRLQRKRGDKAACKSEAAVGQGYESSSGRGSFAERKEEKTEGDKRGCEQGPSQANVKRRRSASEEAEDEEQDVRQNRGCKEQRIDSLPWCEDSEAAEVLLSFPSDQFEFSEAFGDLATALKSGPGILDLFSGVRGVARACTREARCWVLCFDLGHHHSEDLLGGPLQVQLLKLARARVFRAMGAAPVCSSFSTAITPPVRDLLHPAGVPWASQKQKKKNRDGNRMLKFVLIIVVVFLEEELHFWVENPWGSWMWRQRGKLSWKKILASGRVGDLKIGYCRFGTLWRKRTRFRTSLHLQDQQCKCCCEQPHLQLRGKCPKTGVNYTKLAEPYPNGVANIIAVAMLVDTGLLPQRRKLDVNLCAKHCGEIIGEASHPGPARRNHEREGDLFDVSLLEPATISLRARVWEQFHSWALLAIDERSFQWLTKQPRLFVAMLVNYGHEAFRSGTPLHYYRQLLAHVQREYPEVKIQLAPGWETVSKWELMEPVQHRPPFPEPLLEAVLVLAVKWGWKTWAGCTALCFFGACRIGEVLSALRQELLTPEDLLSDEKTVYFRIKSPKSRRRGASVQYTTIDVPFWAEFVCRIFEKLKPQEPLYAGNASAYRSRLEYLLRHIGVGKEHRLTPGSLRGGGAVSAHKRGIGINNLLWKLRLQHMRTLAYYLQETTAVSILPALPQLVRCRIQLLRGLLPKLRFEVLSAAAQ